MDQQSLLPVKIQTVIGIQGFPRLGFPIVLLDDIPLMLAGGYFCAASAISTKTGRRLARGGWLRVHDGFARWEISGKGLSGFRWR